MNVISEKETKDREANSGANDALPRISPRKIVSQV